MQKQGSNELIKLGIASPVFFPTYGGAQLRYYRYIPGLTKSGLDVSVITGTPNRKQETPKKYIQAWQSVKTGEMLPVECVDKASVYRVGLPKAPGWLRALYFNHAVGKFCRCADTRPDLVQFLTNMRPRSIPLLFKLRKLGIPLVYAVTLAPNPKRTMIQRKLNQKLFDLFDCIITNTEALGDMMREIGVTTRIETIPNGVDLDRFRPSVDPNKTLRLKKSLGIDNNAIVVTAVGAVSPRKGSDLLLNAWARLVKSDKNIHLLFVGPRKDKAHPKLGGFSRNLQQIIDNSTMPKNVHFSGHVENVEDYIQASDLIVLASSREGLPNSVLEAMATKIPVILTPFVGLSEDLGKPNEHYYLTERSVDALESGISKVLSNDKLRNEIANNGLQWVKEKMDLNTILNRYANLYQELIKGY